MKKMVFVAVAITLVTLASTLITFVDPAENIVLSAIAGMGLVFSIVSWRFTY